MNERRRRQAFPVAFKLEAAERASTSGLPIARIAQEPRLNQTVLRRWVARHGAQEKARQRRSEGHAAAPSVADLAAVNARLKRELQRAEMQRDILNKAAVN